MSEEVLYISNFESRIDLKRFKPNALLLYALQLRYGIEDIETLALECITESFDDKKTDLIYIDAENKFAVLAQTYIRENPDNKPSAPSNKASDLNTSIAWIINTPIENLPTHLQTHARELREELKNGNIETLNFWYVHNMNESIEVRKELDAVQNTANAAVSLLLSKENHGIQIIGTEVGNITINEWYRRTSNPILVDDSIKVNCESGYFEMKSDFWSALVTTVSAKWLKELYKLYTAEKLFSANIREYLGSRNADRNINKGIQKTSTEEPDNFWVFNNGITALVNKYVINDNGITITGLSIVNGAQTTGAVAQADASNEHAKVQIRFVMCSYDQIIHKIVKFNNSQNKVTASDYRSNDNIQTRIVTEFDNLGLDVAYLNRRGGSDVIKRPANALLSLTAGQILAAFHGDPESAYHKKTHIWESDSLYSHFFNDNTNAQHIIFAFSLFKCIEEHKKNLMDKKNNNQLTETEEKQLEFFRNRGSLFLFLSAVASSLDIVIGRKIPNKFVLHFKDNTLFESCLSLWRPIVKSLSSFAPKLSDALSDGIKNKVKISAVLGTFQSMVLSVADPNKEIFGNFSKEIIADSAKDANRDIIAPVRGIQ